MPTHTFTRNWTNGSTGLAAITPITAGGEQNLVESIAASTTNLNIAFAVEVAKLKGLYILATGALTLHTNSSGSPSNTFTLSASQPFVWVLGDQAIRDTAGAALGNITTLYVTNADSANAATLQVGCIFDPTV